MSVKTAISLDDGLLREADETALRMGLSRSKLFAVALSEYLKRKKQEQMLLQLNEVYASGPTADEQRLLKGMKARLRRAVERK